MSKQATQKGAAKTAAPVSVPNPRIAQIEAIAKKRNEAYKASRDEALAAGLTTEPIEEEVVEQNSQDVPPDSLDDKHTGSVQEEGANTEEEPGSTEAAGGDPALAKLLGDQFVLQDGKIKAKLKIDGQETLVDWDEIKGGTQKLKAADARLREAATVNKQLVQRQHEQDAREARLKSREQPSATADAEIDAEAEAFSQLIVTGTKEEIAAATKKLLRVRPGNAPSIDAKEIVRLTRAELAAQEYDNALLRGMDSFEKDYPEIYKDDDLRAAADTRTIAIAEAHPEWSPDKVILEAAKQVSQKVELLRAPAGGKQLANRQVRKDNLRVIPAQRGGKNEPEPAPKAQTREQYTASLRKARGQS